MEQLQIKIPWSCVQGTLLEGCQSKFRSMMIATTLVLSLSIFEHCACFYNFDVFIALKQVQFKEHMKKIKDINVEAYNYLQAIPTQHWSRHGFSTASKSGMLLNNVCESFNNV